MSAAHLHAVPEPDDVPTTAPAAVETAPGEGPAEGQAAEAEAGDELEDAGDQEDPGGPGEDLDDEGEPGEEDLPRRALTLRDLRPYVTADWATAKELGSLVAEVGRTTAPRVRRGLAPVLNSLWQIIRTGSIVMALVVAGWFSGELAPKVPPLWRLLLGPLVAGYAVVQTVLLYPWAPLTLIAAWPLLAVGAQWWAISHDDRAAKAQAAGKSSGKGSKGGGKGGAKASPKTFAGRLAAALAPPSTEAFPEAPAKTSVEAPDESSGETDQEAVEEAGEELEETPVQEAPTAPSRDDIVRALHTLVGTSSGTLHTALRDHLRYPSTRAARAALERAGIPSRSGVRAVGGNGAGVHRLDFPPLPPSREGSPGSGVAAGQGANNNGNNTGGASGEGLAVEGSNPGPAYPFDIVRDPAGGPAAWKILPRN
jgi:hypothetical protein